MTHYVFVDPRSCIFHRVVRTGDQLHYNHAFFDVGFQLTSAEGTGIDGVIGSYIP